VETANWTTERRAAYLGQQRGIHVTEETVRVDVHAHDSVCKRSTWTLRRKAEEKPDDVGNAYGERFCSPGRAFPNLSAFMICLSLTCAISFPPTWKTCSSHCRVLTSLCKMRCRWLFIQRSPASGRETVDVGNAWSRHLGRSGKSTALVWWTGVMAGSMVALLPDAPLMCSASTSVPQWLVLNSEDELPW
jgi:hypothetical protein